ncbi:MAG: hypothetical protein R3291_00180 [Thermoplasmata archaeon]|nr:hypothetical protein [Thermoplasmata archaeon]
MAEQELVSLFAVLLIAGATLMLFAPLFYRLAREGLWIFGLVLAVPALLLVTLGLSFVQLSFADPAVLAPVVAVVFGMRVVSPTLAFFGVRTRLEGKRAWSGARVGLVAGFATMGVYAALGGVWQAPTMDPLLLSERVAMAAGTAFVFLRFQLKVMPHGSYDMFVLWLAAILFSSAFAVVAPFAFPAYAVLYAVSGTMGWFIAATVAVKAPLGAPAKSLYTTAGWVR